jgi:hypothetical protein
MTENPVPPLPKPVLANKSSALLSPMVLSTLVCPGAGQLMQRRWVVGAFLIVLSSTVFVWFVVKFCAIMIAFYGLPYEMMTDPAQMPDWLSLAVPFGVLLVIWLIGIIDTAIASYRIRVKQNRPPAARRF